MSTSAGQAQKQRITEWIAGGRYAVAVDVEAMFLPDRPGEPFLTPDTVRHLEQVAREARAGNLAALRNAGRVFVEIDQSGSLAGTV
jgi:hypothetical protein